jgi:hypothetical protein
VPAKVKCLDNGSLERRELDLTAERCGWQSGLVMRSQYLQHGRVTVHWCPPRFRLQKASQVIVLTRLQVSKILISCSAPCVSKECTAVIFKDWGDPSNNLPCTDTRLYITALERHLRNLFLQKSGLQYRTEHRYHSLPPCIHQQLHSN